MLHTFIWRFSLPLCLFVCMCPCGLCRQALSLPPALNHRSPDRIAPLCATWHANEWRSYASSIMHFGLFFKLQSSRCCNLMPLCQRHRRHCTRHPFPGMPYILSGAFHLQLYGCLPRRADVLADRARSPRFHMAALGAPSSLAGGVIVARNIQSMCKWRHVRRARPCARCSLDEQHIFTHTSHTFSARAHVRYMHIIYNI